MTWNPFIYFKKSEKVKLVIWKNNATAWEIGTARLNGTTARELGKDRTYDLAGEIPILVREESGSTVPYYQVDAQTGAGLHFVRGESLLQLQTNPDLLHKVIDANFLGQLVGILPGIGLIVLAFLLGVFFTGTLFGLFG